MNAVPDKQLIEDVATELNIDPSFVEKDWYVTLLINRVADFKYLDTQIIFTGGTALSKAHHLIKRFSEDTDFRMTSEGIGKEVKSRQRKVLSEYRKTLIAYLQEDFSIDTASIKSRNDNRFFSFDILYPTVFDRKQALRPHILVECTFTVMAIAPVILPVISLITEVTGGLPEVNAIQCTDPVENACDKLSALIWRVADRDRNAQDDDATIVRHLHDLANMADQVARHVVFKQLAIDTIIQDDNRSDSIKGKTIEQKLKGLHKTLAEDREYEKEYEVFVKGMSYGPDRYMQDYGSAIHKLKQLTALLK